MMHYIKGQGWVYGPEYETREYTMACGTRVRAEARIPNVGERYFAGWNGNWCKSPGIPNFDAWRIESCAFTDRSKANASDINMYTKMSEQAGYAIGWVTLVPL